MVRSFFSLQRPISLLSTVSRNKARKKIRGNQEEKQMNRTYRTLSTVLSELAALALACTAPMAWADDDDFDGYYWGIEQQVDTPVISVEVVIIKQKDIGRIEPEVVSRILTTAGR